MKPFNDFTPGQPERYFWFFALAHAFLWTAVPILCLPGVPVDFPEMIYWAKRFSFSYPKHPPLTYWISGAFLKAAGFEVWSQYVASQLAMLCVFACVWSLAKDFLEKRLALVSVLLLEGIYYYNFMSPEFGQNILILPFWAGAALFTWKALSTRKPSFWVLSGLSIGLGCLTKYSMFALVFPLLVFLLAEPKARASLRTPGPYLAVLAAAAVFAPHALSLLRPESTNIRYLLDRTLPRLDWVEAILKTAQFALIQIGAVIPPAAALYYACGKPWRLEARFFRFEFPDTYLFAAAIGPFITHFLLSLFFGIKITVNMYGAPLWLFIGVFLVRCAAMNSVAINTKKIARVCMVFFFAWLIAFSAMYALGPYLRHKGKRAHFPARNLSEYLESAWDLRYGSRLPAVGGDPWIAGSAGLFLTQQQGVYTDQALEFEDLRLARAIFEKIGGILLWDAQKNGPGFPERFREIFPQAEVQRPIRLRWLTGADIPPAQVGWAIVPPGKKP